MTDRATLEALLARVLEGTGRDRELDAEISLALGIVSSRVGNCFYGHKHYSVLVLDRDYYDHDGNAPELPPYTASLDAVLRDLLPEGWLWVCGSYGNARVYQDQTAGKSFIGENACPERALCEACIRARMEALGD